MNRFALAVFAAVLVVVLAAAAPAGAGVYNLKVVTDASPDYTDMQIHSVTSKWPDTKDKCWAMFYWVHLARRQTAPMVIHGSELGDPIRQFNDYGYAMCSTVAGINCSIWNSMGLKIRFWDIGNHTVSECFYDGRWHIYDDSMSALYTLCDGKTIAGVEDVGKDGACEASGGKTEKFHIARYHCLTGTSTDGYLTGSDCDRTLWSEGNCFRSNVLQYRYYWCGWEDGYRYILNLKDGQTYTRYYTRLDAPKAGGQFAHAVTGAQVETANYYIPNAGEGPPEKAGDPERGFNIRGNGEWTWRVPLGAAEYKKSVVSETNIRPAADGLACANPAKDAEVVFRFTSANVITSQAIHTQAAGMVALEISTNNGLSWKALQGAGRGEGSMFYNLRSEVNGAYEVLVKAKLGAGAKLASLDINTVTQVNGKTLPKFNLGKNTVYVGTGEQTESIVFWPNIGGDQYKELLADEKNVMCAFDKNWDYYGHLHPVDASQEGYVVYRITAPNDLVRLTYGGRFSNRNDKEHIDMAYSLDDGKTWTTSWSLTSNAQPWDTLHHETVAIGAGHKSVLVKYSMFGRGASIYSVIMEANYKAADAAFKPVEVTFNWAERQADYSVVQRSHRQLVNRVPFKYTVNVGGADHPVMESMSVRLPNMAAADGKLKYGYLDGPDPGGQKYVARWQTVGKNFAVGKPYTLSAPSTKAFGASDDAGGKILTDGVVGPFVAGGGIPRLGIAWGDGSGSPEITVDLGKPETCGAFRIHLTAGWPWPDALKGQFKDKVELLTSLDGKDFKSAGFFPMDLRFKDIAINYMMPDSETLQGCNFELIPPAPVTARYVRWKVTPSAGHALVITEVQALDKITYAPFDIRIALPDEK